MVVESVKERILLVEESATLRYILVKALQKQGYELMALETFDAAYDALDSQANVFQAVIIGWPNYDQHKEVDRLIELLEGTEHFEVPALILSHDADIDVLNWMSRRRYTALVPWENYQESVATLQKLLGPETPQEHNHPISSHENPIRILFVDDSVSIRHYYQRLLNRNGYITETANSVDEAFEVALKKPFDLAIIDYFMPDLNGYVLCQKLRDDERTSKIRTAVITGTYLDEVIKDCLQAGAVECMFKNEAEELFLSRIASMSRFIEVQNHIEAERERLAGILESVGEGVYGVDNDGLVTFVNPAALNIIGKLETDSVIGKKAKDAFHYFVKDDVLNHDRLYRAYGNSIELRCWETAFKHESGKPVPVECTVYPLNIHGRQEGSVIAFRDISERKMLEEKLHWQATHDHLTKLCNRRYFEDQLDSEVSRVHSGEDMSALVYLDLDRFKYLNDTAGHDAGDKLLIEISKLLSDKLRAKDTLARLGGDEFAIILKGVDEESAVIVTETFRKVLEKFNFTYGGENYNIYGSFGVAMMDIADMTSGDVLANADIACHIAKRSGRNQSHLYEQSSDEKNVMGSELGWSQRLRDAMDNNKFLLHFQPILDLGLVDLNHLPAEDGAVWKHYTNNKDNQLHYELLLRMQGDNGDLYYPDAFIPTAERFNLMCDVDMWVLNKALGILSEVQKKRSNVSFSINLSGHTLNADDSLNKIKALLKNHDVDPQALIFEVTETCAIANFESASQFIDEMKWLGCRFSLDDFGSGFCSFSQLKCLPADFVKIDGQFVKGMARGSIDRAIVTAMNDVAHSLGRYTVAEYVESPEILRLLKICGVDHVQGNYVSIPRPHLGIAGV
ncbi:MAG: two-component system response regulator [endosymbiont of Galathealinum brachiosum]|uniref:Two-component system response regulator n=1 Tax=endosymbiont of Galathealinum brachiosum TaxID=2200906 RepID=A0A370DE20_9GAMM|nr:MAG: two-component system response regulator [endosymbiont of Galathealinum brachiosum]